MHLRDDCVAEYLWAKRFGTGLSETSLRTIEIELSAWERWLESRRLRCGEVTRDDMRCWYTTLNALQSATIQKKVSILHGFYRWAHLDHRITSDPCAGVERPWGRGGSSPAFIPTRAEVVRILVQPDTTTMIGVRDRAILELLYATGLRADELVRLTVQDVLLGQHDRMFHVMGKGARERIVVYGQPVQTWLKFYNQVARRSLLPSGKTSGQFFLSAARSGKPFRYPELWYLMRRYANKAGVPRLTAHSLRRAFATHLYQGGASLETIRLLLGHVCIGTTAHYIRPNPAYLARLIEHHHPRGSSYVRWHRRPNVPVKAVRWLELARGGRGRS